MDTNDAEGAAALAAAALFLADPRYGLDRVGKDDTVGVCEFFNVYPETVGRMVASGLLRGVTSRAPAPGAPGKVRFAPTAGVVGLRGGASDKLVAGRIYCPSAEAVECAFREADAATWRGCVLSWPHLFAALTHLRAAEVVLRCGAAGVLP